MPNRPNLQRFLNRVTSRSDLTVDEQQCILDLPGQAEQVQANGDFSSVGEHVDHVSLVVAGIVGSSHVDRDGVRQITAMHIPGDICDLHTVIEPTPTSSLQALSVATVLRVPHQAIRAATVRYPQLALALWRDTMVDASILAEWVVNVGRRDAKKRVAHLLCEMATRMAAVRHGDEVMFDLLLTQVHMADATALTAVHVNRTLQDLRADGLVDWRRQLVRLPRWHALVDFAEFDTVYLQNGMQPEQRLRVAQAH